MEERKKVLQVWDDMRVSKCNCVKDSFNDSCTRYKCMLVYIYLLTFCPGRPSPAIPLGPCKPRYPGSPCTKTKYTWIKQLEYFTVVHHAVMSFYEYCILLWFLLPLVLVCPLLVILKDQLAQSDQWSPADHKTTSEHTKTYLQTCLMTHSVVYYRIMECWLWYTCMYSTYIPYLWTHLPKTWCSSRPWGTWRTSIPLWQNISIHQML